MPSARTAAASRSDSAQALDRTGAPRRRDVAPLREDQQGVARGHGCRQAPDLLDHGVLLPGRRVQERHGQPVEQHVDHRVPLEGLLEDHARPTTLPRQQLVDEEERVAGSGMAAQDQQRVLDRLGVAVVTRQVRTAAVDAQDEELRSEPVQDPQEAR